MAFRHLTPQEIEDNYEFKVVKRLVKKEYPWIIDILPPTEDIINQYSVLFVDLVINPYILSQEKDWEIFDWVFKKHREGEYQFSTTYLSVIFDIQASEAIEENEEIERTMKSVKKSPALPEELKIPSGRNFLIHHYHIPHGLVPPPKEQDDEATPEDTEL